MILYNRARTKWWPEWRYWPAIEVPYSAVRFWFAARNVALIIEQ